MDALEFQQQAPADPQLRAFLQEVAEAVWPQVRGETWPFFAVTGLDFLFLVAAYVIFRCIKEGLDGWRNRRETEEASRRAEIIEELVRDGIPPEAAQATVTALLQGLDQRSDDDPALQVAQSLVDSRK